MGGLATLFAFGAQLHAAVASPALWRAGGITALPREVLLGIFWAGIATGAVAGGFARTEGRRPWWLVRALGIGPGASLRRLR